MIAGNPDEAHILTSIIERQNLTMRMSMRRFTRLTNGFSKKLENMKVAVSLHFAHYNFVRNEETRKSLLQTADTWERMATYEDKHNPPVPSDP